MDFRDKQAIYLQIADFVSEQVLLGRWPAGRMSPQATVTARPSNGEPLALPRSQAPASLPCRSVARQWWSSRVNKGASAPSS